MVSVISLMPGTPPPPAVEVIKARATTSAGNQGKRIAVLEQIDEATLDADERALVGLAMANALQTSGHSDEYSRVVQSLAALGHSNPVVNRLTQTWALMGAASLGGSLSEAGRSLNDWRQRRRRLASLTSPASRFTTRRR